MADKAYVVHDLSLKGNAGYYIQRDMGADRWLIAAVLLEALRDLNLCPNDCGACEIPLGVCAEAVLSAQEFFDSGEAARWANLIGWPGEDFEALGRELMGEVH